MKKRETWEGKKFQFLEDIKINEFSNELIQFIPNLTDNNNEKCSMFKNRIFRADLSCKKKM